MKEGKRLIINAIGISLLLLTFFALVDRHTPDSYSKKEFNHENKDNTLQPNPTQPLNVPPYNVLKSWIRTFGGTGIDLAYMAQPTSDGGYIVAGENYSHRGGDVWLFKTDSSGTKLWDKIFGGPNDDWAKSVQPTTEGGFIIAGMTDPYSVGSYRDALLIKTDSNGNELWEKTFGGQSDESARSVQQTSDGGYIIAGETTSYGAGLRDAWLIKTDSYGDKLWDRTFGGPYDDSASSVQQTSDGGYIIAGETSPKGSGKMDAWLIKTDSYGIKIWDKTFGGSDIYKAKSVRETSDGGYIVAGAANSNALLIKTDSSGNANRNEAMFR